MSGSNYNFLANPTGAQPIDWQKGIQSLNMLRDQQAQQAEADAWRATTNPLTGETDSGRFRGMVSQGAGAWNAAKAIQAQGNATNAQAGALSTQLANAATTSKQLSLAALAIVRDPSDAQVNSSFANLEASYRAAGIPIDKAEAEWKRWLAMSQDERQKNAYQIGIQHIDALHQYTGTTSLQNTGSKLEPVTTVQPSPYTGGGSASVGAGGAPLGLTQGEQTDLVTVHLGNGVDQQMLRRDVPAFLAGNPGATVAGAGGGGGPAPGPVDKDTALDKFAMRESGMQNIRNRQGPNGTPASTASGYWQIIDSTWRDGAKLAGVDTSKYPTAMSAPYNVQRQVAGALYDKYGEKPWQTSAPGAGSGVPVPGGGGLVRYPDGSMGTPGGGGLGTQPAPAAPAAPPPAPGPVRGQTLAPGQVEALRSTAEAGAKRGNDLVNQAQATANIKPVLSSLYADIDAAGGTGVGSKSIGVLQQLGQRFGLAPEAFNAEAKQSAQDQFTKNVALLQGAQLGQLGMATDSRQELAAASNPSLSLSSAGNKGIIRMLQGNQDAIDTMGRAWLSSPEYQTNPGGFDAWRSKFTAKDPATGGEFDPRVFWMHNMNPAEQKKYISSLSDSAYAQYRKNYALARNNNWVAPVSAAGSP